MGKSEAIIKTDFVETKGMILSFSTDTEANYCDSVTLEEAKVRNHRIISLSI